MDNKRKKLLKQSFSVIFKGDIEEILEKKVTKFGSGSHTTLPKKHIGKNAKVIIYRD